MKVLKDISITRFIAQVFFILVPTVLVVFFILFRTNHYFSFLQEKWITQTSYFAAGIFISYFIYQFRLRFLPTFIVLLLVLFSIHKVIDTITLGEFDSLTLNINFLVFSYLFSFGWLFGWAFQRLSFSPILITGILVSLSIFLISKSNEITVGSLLLSFSPIALYGIYIIYTYEALKNIEQTNVKFWFRFVIRFVTFIGLLLLLFTSVAYWLYPQIKERTEEYGGMGKEGEQDMLKRNKDGTLENKKSMGMGGSNKKNQNPEPLFCAHINSFFLDSDIPNPLYLTSYHYSKYDEATETFERDTSFLLNDEFVPDIAQVPLFFTYKDSSKIKNAKGFLHKKTVEIEVYKKQLSSSAFIAPSTAFWVQPITVEKDFQKEFSSAYRAKSYVSDLNSAYFIYNTENPFIKSFQEDRFKELRKAKNYAIKDSVFFNYYTTFPQNPDYEKIKVLANQISKGKTTTIDKVIAVRDYFLQRNEVGEKVYSYTDNPGVPGLPGASKLLYFLFESKKGYCAYYAGATVFLLRAMKIPSRVVTGFLTVDRSDKNKGWYWFYEDQSHGWVQVYFPEYGWIDFDTTVGNEEAEQSPKPDGTPPLEPPKAVLASSGKIILVDTLKKNVDIKISHLVFKDVEYNQLNEAHTFDISRAIIWKDSMQISSKNLQKGDDVMLVSYDDRINVFSAEKNAKDLFKKLPIYIPVDDVFVKDIVKNKNDENKNEINTHTHTWKYYLALTLIILFLLFAVIFSLPYATYFYYKQRYKNATSTKLKSYYIYKSATFLLHQLKVSNNNLTALQFAKKVVDVRYQTQFEKFMLIYLKEKYANQNLTEEENTFLNNFYHSFVDKVKCNFPLKVRVISFLNLNQYVSYFFKWKEEA